VSLNCVSQRKDGVLSAYLQKNSFSLTFRSCKTPSLISVFNMWWRIDGSSDCVFLSFYCMRNVFSFSRLIKTVLYPVLAEVSLCVTSCFQTHACLMGTAENKNVFCYSQTKNCSESRYHFWYCFCSVIRTLVHLCEWGEQNKVKCDILYPNILYTVTTRNI